MPAGGVRSLQLLVGASILLDDECVIWGAMERALIPQRPLLSNFGTICHPLTSKNAVIYISWQIHSDLGLIKVFHGSTHELIDGLPMAPVLHVDHAHIRLDY